MSNLSSRYYCVWKELKGSQLIELKYGYRNIIELILGDFKKQFESKLHLRHALKKIIICSNQSDCIHCRYTSDKEKLALIITDLELNKDLIVLCDKVVCTMSLGYLKHNITSLIEPKSLIPNEKLLAVSRLGYGTVNKIFLIYDKPFWQDTMQGFHPIWLLKTNETIFSKLDDIKKTNWFENIGYFKTIDNHKNILLAWLSGSEFVEYYSEEKISHDCTMLLRKFFNDNSIPEPIKIIK